MTRTEIALWAFALIGSTVAWVLFTIAVMGWLT